MQQGQGEETRKTEERQDGKNKEKRREATRYERKEKEALKDEGSTTDRRGHAKERKI